MADSDRGALDIAGPRVEDDPFVEGGDDGSTSTEPAASGPETSDDTEGMDEPDGGTTLADRVRDVRRGVENRKAERRVRDKADDLKERAESKRREERIENRDPESVTESAAAASNETRLLAAELGITTDRASSLASRAMGALSDAAEAGSGALAAFDTDGDGDTDILQALEDGKFEPSIDEPVGDGSSRQPEPPVGDVEDDFDALAAEGVEADVGLDYPVEDDF